MATAAIGHDGVVRVALDEEDFRTLVAGRIVATSPGHGRYAMAVEIILSDIGWNPMANAIADAIAESPGSIQALDEELE